MNPVLTQHCLVLLREVDIILIQQREIALATHLSLVIERLAERIRPMGPRPPSLARTPD